MENNVKQLMAILKEDFSDCFENNEKDTRLIVCSPKEKSLKNLKALLQTLK